MEKITDFKLYGHRERVERAKEFWVRVATDLNAGLTPAQIAARYKNPATGRVYTREHIYWVIRKLRERLIRKEGK